jgi:N,N'-diacetyllegionaminate synthase
MPRSTFIIAEVGVNHGGDVGVAEELVKAAKLAGADAVKFQTFDASRLVTSTAPKASYQRRATSATESQHRMLRDLELSREAHERLVECCRASEIEFMSSAFDEGSAAFLYQLGLRRLKIPSGEITNLPFLRHLGGFEAALILSTGMATLDEVIEAVDVLERAGTKRSSITVLHCTTEYPAPMRDVNLLAMVTLATTIGVEVGYSDHTLGIEVPIAAVALGAAVIEKHLTLDRSRQGPDHQASLEPSDFAKMVESIRNIESALGDGVKRAMPSELTNMAVARKSLVAATHIRMGELFSPQNIVVKRPGDGISPMRWDEVMGMPATRAFAADEVIEI